jgi:hypoxia up-regulated 1
MTQALGRGAVTNQDDWIKELEKGDHHLFWLRNATVSDEALPSLEGEPDLHRLMVQVGDSIVYTEEVLSQLLAKARQYATTEAGAPVKDCAITVPFYWSHAQRQALIDAAHLAGFNVLSLMNQNMAIAVKFLTDRDFDDGAKYVVFYDMGTSDLQVSLYRFESAKGKGKTKWINNATLIATAADSGLGGSAFDSIIADSWIDKVKAKFGNDFVLPPQAITKLQKQAKKTKEVLSANKESHVTIESLLPDYDFKTSISREEFEKKAEKLFERALVPLKKVMEAANLSPQQLDFFEMFGGGARIPKIQDALRAYLDPVPLSRHLNTDEAAAFGAAIYAASKSSQHRVKDFNVKDGSNAHYPVMVRATDIAGKSLVVEQDGNEPELDKILYKETSRLGSRRTLKITTEKDIYVQLKYPASVELEEGVSHLISKHKISFPKDLHSRYNLTDTPTAHIRFEITSSGTVILTSADAQVPIITQKIVKVKVESPTQEHQTETSTENESSATSDENTASDKEASEQATDEVNAENDASESSGEDSSRPNQSSEADETPSPTEEVIEEKTTVPEEKTEIREIHSTITVKLVLEPLASIGLTPAQLSEAKRRLKVLDDEEKDRLDTERAKSDLEALVYAIYDKLEDSDTKKFSTEEERAALTELLGTESTWLEEDGADAIKADYLDHKAALSKQWNKITTRISEARDFPIAVEKCQNTITAARDALVLIQETRNVTASDIESVLEAIGGVEEFVKTSQAEESAKANHEDPKVLSTQINVRCREFGWRIEYLSKRPRKAKPVEPKVTVEPVTETTEESHTSTESANAAHGDINTPKEEL